MNKQSLLILLLLTITRASEHQFVWAVTNTHSHPTSFCVYNTPAEGIRGRILEVRRTDPNPKEIEYRGIMVKRAPPTAENYLTLAPGESFRTSVNINDAYDISEPGTYEIKSKGLLPDLQEAVKEGKYMPGSVFLSTKLELVQTPVELDDVKNFKKSKETVESAKAGSLLYSDPIEVKITSSTKLSKSFVTYEDVSATDL